MNLVKELKKTAKKNGENFVKEQNDILDQVKENIQFQNRQDLEILKHFGTSKVVNEAYEKKTTGTKIIKGEWLTEEDIKTVCDKYALKCLPTSYYKNEVPLHALNDIRKFVTEKYIKLNGEKLDSSGKVKPQTNFFIIAPKSHFKLTRRPQKDPVPLYKNENGLYEILTMWGNDFNFWQRIKGAFQWSAELIFSLILLPIVGFSIDLLRFNAKNSNLNNWGGAITFVGGIVLLILIGGGFFDSWYNKPKYNEPYKN